jgi:metallo-beta-lactamase family protein
MKLTFLGAAGTVTGSKYLLTGDDTRVLVDCGLFQGVKKQRQRNWDEPPFDPKTIDAVIATHAHIDHTGYLPVLIRRGYKGPIYCTTATKQLCDVLLPDSGYLQEEEARYLNKHRFTKHEPALPLYTQEEAEATLKFFKTVPFDSAVALDGGFEFRFTRAGHILGSACIHVTHSGRTVVFSGDVGRPNGPVMKPPAPIHRADYLVVESTYGNRRHTSEDPSAELAEVIRRTVERDGTVVIPAFAVGRTQAILHLLTELRDRGEIPKVPTYLNSPMAINATEIYCEHAGEHRLNRRECAEMFGVAEMVRSPQASKALNSTDGPAVIISASGMATGGRVVHHLKTLLPDPRNTVLFTGFQAPGTRGEQLLSGAEHVKIHGQIVPVRAEVVALHGLSAHADYSELLDWLSLFKEAPSRTFITHGEPVAADAFRFHMRDRLGWEGEVPEYLQTVKL